MGVNGCAVRVPQLWGLFPFYGAGWGVLNDALCFWDLRLSPVAGGSILVVPWPDHFSLGYGRVEYCGCWKTQFQISASLVLSSPAGDSSASHLGPAGELVQHFPLWPCT